MIKISHNHINGKTLLILSKKRIGMITVSAALLALTGVSSAEIPSQAFSGLNHFIPVHARLPLYKLKAQKSRIRSRASDLANQPPWGDTRTYGYAGAPGLDSGSGLSANNCSLNIGNITPGDSAASYGPKETIVLIEGDVINAADCTR